MSDETFYEYMPDNQPCEHHIAAHDALSAMQTIVEQGEFGPYDPDCAVRAEDDPVLTNRLPERVAEALHQRIAELEAENAALRAQLDGAPVGMERVPDGVYSCPALAFRTDLTIRGKHLLISNNEYEVVRATGHGFVLPQGWALWRPLPAQGEKC